VERFQRSLFAFLYILFSNGQVIAQSLSLFTAITLFGIFNNTTLTWLLPPLLLFMMYTIDIVYDIARHITRNKKF